MYPTPVESGMAPHLVVRSPIPLTPGATPTTLLALVPVECP